ncbi:MAG: hypothetical protein QOK21_2812 [Solirubrobacteraceae bacterium]|nr:hypothetical protein [Solirubrobacteraceae bacterium]
MSPRPDRDRAIQFAKRLRRRIYLADYTDENLRNRWVGESPAPYSEQVFDVRPDPETTKTILIFKPDEIGDAVYSLPAVRALKQHFPNAQLFLLCQRLTEPLYQRSGLFDEIVAVEPGSWLTRPTFDVERQLARFSVGSFDLSIFLRTYPAYFRQFLKIPSRARLHPADPGMRSDSVYRAHVSLWDDERAHQALQLLEIVGKATGQAYTFDDVTYPEFAWTEDDRRADEIVFGGAPPERYVVVHPFAKDETRQYPLSDWAELIARVRDDLDATWVIVGGPGDPQLESAPGVIQAQGKLTLSQTGLLSAGATAFLGVLSGPAHWAAALGTPTVTVMSGHSLPVEWAPLGRTLVLRADVPCAPCHQKTCPVYGLACLTELRPERIAPSVARFLVSAGA